MALGIIGSFVAAPLVAQPVLAASCGGVDTSIISCEAGKDAKSPKDSAIWQVLLIVVNILTAGVGLAAVGGVIYGAILYTTAEDRPEQVSRAKTTIFNVVLGLVSFILMWGFLQFLIPGGVLNG